MVKTIEGDITTLAVDAIVNAANQPLLGGGGVGLWICVCGRPNPEEETFSKL